MKEILFVLILVVLPSTSFSNSSSNTASPTHNIEVIADFAKQVENELATRKAHVALVARKGRSDDELPAGVIYTHVGLAVYSSFIDGNGDTKKGYVMHNLYQTAERSNVSALIQDFPFDFFSQATVLKAGVIIPNPKLQKRILMVLNSPTYTELHNPRYSAMSNPFNNQYQNCTEFVLNVLQSALYSVSDMHAIKQSLTDYYEPYDIRVSKLKIMLGAIFSKELALGDHMGGYKTATFTSIEEYMSDYNLSTDSFAINY